MKINLLICLSCGIEAVILGYADKDDVDNAVKMVCLLL